MVEKTNLENALEDSNVPSKLHTCPLNNWCDQCVFCEFNFDELKIKAGDKDLKEVDLILNEKLESIQCRLNEVENAYAKHLKQSAESAREKLELKFQSLKEKIDKIKEQYVNKVDTVAMEMKSKLNEEYDEIMSEQAENIDDLDYIKEYLEQNLKLAQDYFDFEVKLSIDEDSIIGENQNEMQISMNRQLKDMEWNLQCPFTTYLESFENDIIFKNILKNDVLDVQILDSDIFVCSYKDKEEIDIFNLHDESHIRSITYNLNKTKVFPMSTPRLILASSDEKTEITIWDLKTNESKKHILKDGRGEQKDTYNVYFVLGESHIIARRENASTYFEPFDCCIWLLNDFEIKFYKKFKIESLNFELWPVNADTFASFLPCSISIWNSNGILVRDISINSNYIYEMRAIGNYLTYRNNDFNIEILSLETDNIIESFENCKLIGNTPYEIFLHQNDSDIVKVYAIDDYLTYLGQIKFDFNTKVDEIAFIYELSWFIFRDENQQCLDIKKISGSYRGIKKQQTTLSHRCKSQAVNKRCACCEMSYDSDDTDLKDPNELKIVFEKSIDLLQDAKNTAFQIIRDETDNLKYNLNKFFKKISQKLDKCKEKNYERLDQDVTSCLHRAEDNRRPSDTLIERFETILSRTQQYYEIQSYVQIEDEKIKLALINELKDESNDYDECSSEYKDAVEYALENLIKNRAVVIKICQKWKYLEKFFNSDRYRSFSKTNIDYFNYFILNDKIALTETHRGNKITLFDPRDANNFQNFNNNDPEIEIETIHSVNDKFAVVTTCNRDWSEENVNWLSIWYWQSGNFKKLEPLNSKFVELCTLIEERILVVTTCSYNFEEKPLITTWEIGASFCNKIETKESDKIEKLVPLIRQTFASLNRTEVTSWNQKLDILASYKQDELSLENINTIKYLMTDLLVIQGEAIDSSETVLVIANFKDKRINHVLNVKNDVDDVFVTADKNFLVIIQSSTLRFHEIKGLNSFNGFNNGFRVEQFCQKHTKVNFHRDQYICTHYVDNSRYLSIFDFNKP